MVTLADVLNGKQSINDYSVKATDKSEYSNENVSVLDREWFDLRFIPPSDKMHPVDARNRYYSTAADKFMDTRIGGSLAINPRAQFCQYSDIRVKNRVHSGDVTVNDAVDSGLGRFYSEVFEDNQQLVFITFGIPRFNSLPDFFLSAIDYRDSYIANTGRLPTGYDIGSFLGKGIMLAAFPLMTITIWSLKFITKLALGNSSFDYYYLEPTMHMYWSGVNNMVTTLATELGLLIPELMPEGTEADKIGVPAKLDTKDIEEMKSIAPDLLTDNNYIDVFQMAVRPQVLANRMLLNEKELYDKGDISEYDFLGYVYEDGVLKERKSAGSTTVDKTNYKISFNRFLTKLTKGDGLFASAPEEKPTEESAKVDAQYTKDGKGMYPVKSTPEKESYMSKLTEAIDAGIKEGGMYAIFAVDYTGSVSESFSNSVGNIDTGDKIKSVASTARNMKFNLAGGNIAGETVKDILSAGKNMLSGALDSVTFGLSNVIQTLTGSGYVDIPKKWESSEISLPTISYSMQLRRTYNTPLSAIRDELIPFAMILNAVLPLSAGRSSHTSPYLCELFCKGVQHIKLGMITSVSITRATGNLGFDKLKRPLGIDITFTVTDLSSIMTAPVNNSMFDIFNVALEDDTPLNRYLATVASRDLLTSKYMVPKVKLRASRLLMNLDQAMSPHAWGMRTGLVLNSVLGGVVADHALSLTQKN